MPRLRVNASALSSFLDCRQQAAYKDAGFELLERKFAPRLGDVVHECLSAIYTARQNLPHPFASRSEASAWVRQTLPEFLTGYTKEAASQIASPQQVQDFYLAVKFALALVTEHFSFWDDLLSGAGFEVIASEGKFSVPFLDNFVLYGRRDLVIKRRKDGSKWIVDHKIMSQVRPDELMDLAAISLQNRLYTLAFFLEHGEFPSGMIYNVIRAPGLNPRKGRGKNPKKENPAAFQKRLQEDIHDRAESYFMRFEVQFAKSDVLAWQDQFAAKLDDYLKWNLGQVPTYRNDSGNICYGRYSCPFIQVCGNGGSIADNPLYRQSDHRPQRWTMPQMKGEANGNATATETLDPSE